MVVAPATTWLLVSTMPDDWMTMPVPAARAFWYPSTVSTSTTALLTVWAMASGFTVPPPEPGVAVGAGMATPPGRLVLVVPVGWCVTFLSPKPMPAAATASSRTNAASDATTAPGRTPLRLGGAYPG